MVDRLLVPVDESDLAKQACDFVCREFPDATMVLLHVIDPSSETSYASASLPSFSEEWYEHEKERTRALFEDIEATACDSVTIERATEVGNPTSVIVDFASDEDNDIDHVVMGSHSRSGVSRLLLGSVSETVVRRSPVPVTVIR